MWHFLKSSRATLFLHLFNKLFKHFLSVVVVFCGVFYIFEILKVFKYFSDEVQGIDVFTYLSLHFFVYLPIVLPISLLISILSVYKALFTNNEFLLSYMLNIKFFFYPIIVLSAFVFLISIQVNFFLKPLSLYKAELLSKKFRILIYKNMQAKNFQFGYKNNLFYAKKKMSNKFLSDIFLFLPSKKNLSIVAKKSRTFLQKNKLLLELYDGKIYNLSLGENFTYQFSIMNIVLQSLSSIRPRLKYYTWLDFKTKSSSSIHQLKNILIYKYKAIALALSCIFFSLLAWLLLPMNFYKNKLQFITAFFNVFAFFFIYSMCLKFAELGHLAKYFIFVLPNLWIALVCLWIYIKKEKTILSERTLLF